MELAISLVGVSATAVVALGGLWLRYLEAAGPSRRIRADQALLESLHEGSESAAQLTAAIDDQIIGMLKDRDTKRRSVANVVLGLVLVALGVLGVIGSLRGGYWNALWLISVMAALVGLFGFFDGLIPGERDARGNRVRQDR